MNDLLSARHVHFVGIGGIGMSALARYLLARGHRVSGSDRAASEQTAALQALGAQIFLGHEAQHIVGADLVVMTSAAASENPEVRAAQEGGIPVVKRAVLLGAIANAGRGIAIAGTHGKTTTSALVGHLLESAGLNPTVLIGGVSHTLGSNARIGGELVVVEADEYDRSFLQLHPEIAVITNADADHLDIYGTAEQVHAAFRRFAEQVSGPLIICADDPILPGLVADLHPITYGIEAGTHRAEAVTHHPKPAFTLDGRRYHMDLLGRHNVQNAIAAILVARQLGVPDDQIASGLAGFRGVSRRCEMRGEAGGVLVLDDYAHHPTEISSTLAAIKQRYGRPLRVVFQPHTYSRTHDFLHEFAAAFHQADTVYLLDIYAARETDTRGVSSQQLAALASQQHPAVFYTGTAEETVERVGAEVQPGDVVVTMGAGDVYRLGPEILRLLEGVHA